MKFNELSNTWKCVCACLVGVATVCSIAIGFDSRYLLASTGKAMQTQMYVMQLNANIRDYQAQIRWLRTQPQTPAVKAQIVWFQNEINRMMQAMKNAN